MLPVHSAIDQRISRSSCESGIVNFGFGVSARLMRTAAATASRAVRLKTMTWRKHTTHTEEMPYSAMPRVERTRGSVGDVLACTT